MTTPVRIPFTSPFYPLPEDYPLLTTEGQRMARTNACRQWQLAGSPHDRGQARAASVNFFDRYYLWPDEDASFNPSFYDQPPLPTPDMHLAILAHYGSSNLNAVIAPRGSAKSSLCRKDSLCLLASHPTYSIVYATSSNDNAKASGSAIRDQLYENARLNDDFCPDYAVDRFRPARGVKPTGTELFYTNAGGWVRCISAQSRSRGLRPYKFKLDDPEFDESASTSMQVIRDYMSRLLFKIALPMVLRRGAGIDWTATFVSKRHYAWSAMSTVKNEKGETVAEDPRFNYWNRLLIVAAIPDPADPTRYISCWEQMWPSSIESRIAQGISDPISIPEIRVRMGAAAFDAEMQAKPGDSDSTFFHLDPALKGRHAWWLESVDDLFASDPFSSSATICWLRNGSPQHLPLGQFLRSCRIFLTVDTAYTENATSDRRAVSCLAINPHNELFSLDLWSDRKPDSELVRRAMMMAQRWHASAINIEVVRESYKLYERFSSYVTTGAAATDGFTHLPAIRKIKPGSTAKTDKIGALDTRFEQSTIKFPWFLLPRGLWWTRLRDQIEGFNPDAPDGGLEKDDELDTVAMSLFVIKGRVPARHSSTKSRIYDPIEAVAKGHVNLPGTSVPIMSGYPLQLLTPTDLGRVLSAHERRHKSEPETRV